MAALPNELTASSLKELWHSSRDSGKHPGRAGVDRVTGRAFDNDLDENIRGIIREIREDAFAFSPLFPTFVPKADNSDRVICVPTVRDRLVQRALSAYLERDDRLRLRNPISFGFQRGLSVKSACDEAVRRRAEKPFVLKVDVVKFFDNIDRDLAKDLANRAISSSKIVRRLVSRAIDVEVFSPTPEVAERIEAAGIRRNWGLRQGMPLSPILSNLFLRQFDRTLTSAGVVAIRYVDDILLFGSSHAECEAGHNLIAAALGAVNCQVYPLGTPGKAEIYGPRETVEFLGLDVKHDGSAYVISAPFRRLSKIREKMGLLASKAECIKKKRTFGSVSRSLEAYMGGYIGTVNFARGYAEFMGELRAARESALKDLAIELLGRRTVEHLSLEEKQVLGIAPY